MKSAVDEVRMDMDNYYETFMCVLCDGKNHSFFSINKSIKKSKVTLNAEFCQSMLKNHSKSVKLFNVKLVNILEMM